MEAKTSDFKLGLFALVSVGLLCAGLFAFGAASYFQKQYVLETYLKGNADGLSVGTPVTLRGVKVGRVKRMDFSWNVYDMTGPQYVIVEFEVRNNISPGLWGNGMAERIQAQVEKGLRARIKPEGFTGSSLLSLEYVDPAEYPPPPFPWKPRHVCIPSAPGQFGEILDCAQKTLHNISELDLKGLGGSLQRDLVAAEKLMDRLERDLGGAEKLIAHLDEANIQGLATNADALISQLRCDVKEMQLVKLSNDADETIRGVKGTLDRLDLVVANLDTGSLNDALANVRLASKDLDETLVKLNKYPAGFLLGRAPPQAKSVDKTIH